MITKKEHQKARRLFNYWQNKMERASVSGNEKEFARAQEMAQKYFNVIAGYKLNK
jgi:hypothetical protein